MRTPNNARAEAVHPSFEARNALMNSANKNGMKKFQSQTKSTIILFGKLLLSWKDDVHQIQCLLSEFEKLFDTGVAVQRTLTTDDVCFGISFPDLKSSLIANVHREVESVLTQLRQFE